MIASIAVVTALLVVALVAWRLQRRTAADYMLSELQPGMPVTEVAARFERAGIAFTTASTAEGGTVLRFAREVAHNGAASEQQAVFDGHGRLVGLRAVTEIRGP